MMEARAPSGLWVSALLRRVQLAGASAFVLQRGDPDRGDILIKVSDLSGGARAYVPSFDVATGARTFADLQDRGIGASEGEIDTYISRAKDRDRDLWIVEIEDREGRHFLTEAIDKKS